MTLTTQLLGLIALLFIALVLSLVDLYRHRRTLKHEQELDRRAIKMLAERYGKKPGEIEASIRRSGIVKRQKREARQRKAKRRMT